MGLFKLNKRTSVSVGGEYFGTHPAIKGYYQSLRLTMDDAGVGAYDGKSQMHHFIWSEITGYDNEFATKSDTHTRLTATRMLTMGVFALAAPKVAGRVESSFNCTLRTTTGDIVLETKLEGGAGAITSLAIDTINKNGQKVRVFVAKHATGR